MGGGRSKSETKQNAKNADGKQGGGRVGVGPGQSTQSPGGSKPKMPSPHDSRGKPDTNSRKRSKQKTSTSAQLKSAPSEPTGRNSSKKKLSISDQNSTVSAEPTRSDSREARKRNEKTGQDDVSRTTKVAPSEEKKETKTQTRPRTNRFKGAALAVMMANRLNNGVKISSKVVDTGSAVTVVSLSNTNIPPAAQPGIDRPHPPTFFEFEGAPTPASNKPMAKKKGTASNAYVLDVPVMAKSAVFNDGTRFTSPSIKKLRQARPNTKLRSAALAVIMANRLSNAAAASSRGAGSQDKPARLVEVDPGKPGEQRIMELVKEHFGRKVVQIKLEELESYASRFQLAPHPEAATKKMGLVKAVGVHLHRREFKKLVAVQQVLPRPQSSGGARTVGRAEHLANMELSGRNDQGTKV